VKPQRRTHRTTRQLELNGIPAVLRHPLSKIKTLTSMKLQPTLLLFVALVCGALTARADMVNRWSFNNTAGDAPNGTAMSDTISGASATVRCGTAANLRGTFTGTALTLPGATTGNQTAANISAYLDLPNGIISSKPNLTVEAWITPVSSKTWQRLFDFGRANVTVGPGAATGEIIDTTTAPGAYTAFDNLTLCLNNNTTFGSHRFEGRIANGTRLNATQNLNASTTAGTEYHYVLTVADGAGTSGASGCQLAFYRNGTLQRTLDLNFRLPQIADVNNWIGRSQYGIDSNSNITINELRLYNHTMSAAEIAASFTAGPNPSFVPPVAVDDTVTMHRGQKARIAVLANDTGTLSGSTLIVVTPPQFGTAVADGAGRILYTHTTGSPSGDSFTYRVSGPGGMSAPATVTITFSNSLRIANSTLNVPSTPPPLATQLTAAFTGVSNPVAMETPPGETLRLFVCEKGGLLKLFTNISTNTTTPVTFLDLPTLLTSRGETMSTASEQGLLGVAFHPNYATNRFFYVFYSVTKSGSVYERVSRFTTQAGNANAADAASELVLIEQLDQAGNHNGGDLHFGPDGYLYVSFGDEGISNDTLNNSQTITKDFFSAIARIDVDKKPGSLEPNAHAAVPTDAGVARFSVPVDNPFVHTSLGGTWGGTFNGSAVANLALVRSEFWAVGLRNPWRFSFDAQNGELWVGDVGQDAYEEVDVVTKGGNYGWAFREAAHNGPKSASAPANFDTLYHSPPLYEYTRTGSAGGDANFKGNSVSGGLVYRGTRFPSLTGRYIFSDYVSGNVWSLVRNGGGAPTVTRIAGEVGVVAFGTDPSNGDVLLADYDGARILRLTIETVTGSYPATLGETGLFADLTDLSPAPGLLPYGPNLPFWSDYAVKRRWFIIPDAVGTMTWSRDGLWSYPNGQIWVKHFDMEMTHGNPATKKRIETRVLVKNTTGAYGVSYRWNDAQTEATLVPDGGVDFDLNLTVSGSPYTQRWSIPSRASCLACHTPQAGHALSFNTRQLNLTNTINGFSGNQLTLLQNAGYFSNTPGSPNVLPRHLRPDETSFPIEARVRSYLAVNCAYCHQTGGTAAPAAWDGRHELTLDQTGLINGVAANNGGSALNKLIVPGNTTRSIVLNRMAVTNGFTRMPPLGSSELDQTNIALVTDWISNTLPSRQTYADWRLAQFGSANSPEGEPAYDADSDGANNTAEFLSGTNPLYGGSYLALQASRAGGYATVTFNVPANRSATVETSFDLATWSLWDAPGNAGLLTTGGTITLTGPSLGSKQFFRLRVKEN